MREFRQSDGFGDFDHAPFHLVEPFAIPEQFLDRAQAITDVVEVALDGRPMGLVVGVEIFAELGERGREFSRRDRRIHEAWR